MDASGFALGAVLSQKDEDGKLHPIEYGSRPLGKHELNHVAAVKEGLATVWALCHFHSYILNHEVIIISDCQALSTLLMRNKD